VVDTSRYTEGLIVDKVYFEAADACIGTCACDLGFEVLFELEGPGCLPRGGVAADENELWASVAKIWGKSNVEGLTGIFVSHFFTSPGRNYPYRDFNIAPVIG
jgi:hypothetical protein